MATVDASSNNKETSTMNEAESAPKPIEDSSAMNGDKKEEESVPIPSTSTSESTTKSEDELLASALKLMEKEDYNSAVSLLSNAMEIIQQKKNATSIESVKYYMSYGEALLRLIQSCNDLFAAPIREKQQQYITEEQEEEAPVLINDAVTDPENTENDKNQINSKEEQEDEEEDEDEDDDIAPNEVSNKAEINGDIDTSEDREIAWETLEYARTIIEDYLKIKENENDNEKMKMLANVHSFLGEICIEDENNEMALKEFEEALNLQNQCKNGIIKYREKAFNHFMACLAAQFLEKNDEALKHCNIALNGLSLKIKGLLKQFECNEIKENDNDEIKYDELIKIGQDFIEKKMDETKKNNQNGKELKNLINLMADLMNKMEEVQQMMEIKKNNDENNNNNNNDNDGNGGIMNLMNSNDPLSALINGLTKKFGINEEELAQLDENKNNENDVNDDDIKDNNKNEGITTIGFGGNNNDNDNDEDDDIEINDLGSFGGKKKKEENEENTMNKTVSSSSRKKRSLEEAEIDDGLNGNVKRMKLNSGDAAIPVIVENEDGK